MFSIVPLTLEQIVEEARHWPPEKVGELVGRLTPWRRSIRPHPQNHRAVKPHVFHPEAGEEYTQAIQYYAALAPELVVLRVIVGFD